jgi:hypothetical protein
MQGCRDAPKKLQAFHPASIKYQLFIVKLINPWIVPWLIANRFFKIDRMPQFIGFRCQVSAQLPAKNTAGQIEKETTIDA